MYAALISLHVVFLRRDPPSPALSLVDSCLKLRRTVWTLLAQGTGLGPRFRDRGIHYYCSLNAWCFGLLYLLESVY